MNEQESTRGRRISLTACAVVLATSMGTAHVDAASPIAAQPTEMIERYCATSWRNAQIAPQDWSDCTQEAFVRLLQRVPRDRLGKAVGDSQSSERRELNRSIWATTQKWRRAPRHVSATAMDLADDMSVESAPAASDNRWEAVQASLASLSSRQREILARWSDGDSIAEIAQALELSPARVSDEKYKAIQKVRRDLSLV